jgi:hypothetical protein
MNVIPVKTGTGIQVRAKSWTPADYGRGDAQENKDYLQTAAPSEN